MLCVSILSETMWQDHFFGASQKKFKLRSLQDNLSTYNCHEKINLWRQYFNSGMIFDQYTFKFIYSNFASLSF